MLPYHALLDQWGAADDERRLAALPVHVGRRVARCTRRTCVILSGWVEARPHETLSLQRSEEISSKPRPLLSKGTAKSNAKCICKCRPKCTHNHNHNHKVSSNELTKTRNKRAQPGSRQSSRNFGLPIPADPETRKSLPAGNSRRCGRLASIQPAIIAASEGLCGVLRRQKRAAVHCAGVNVAEQRAMKDDYSCPPRPPPTGESPPNHRRPLRQPDQRRTGISIMNNPAYDGPTIDGALQPSGMTRGRTIRGFARF